MVHVHEIQCLLNGDFTSVKKFPSHISNGLLLRKNWWADAIIMIIVWCNFNDVISFPRKGGFSSTYKPPHICNGPLTVFHTLNHHTCLMVLPDFYLSYSLHTSLMVLHRTCFTHLPPHKFNGPAPYQFHPYPIPPHRSNGTVPYLIHPPPSTHV